MASSEANEEKSLIGFFRLVGRLKHLKRTGWVKRGVSEPEDVAGHMYRMSLMALVASGRAHVDQTRCVKMALVHDLAEAIVGDLTPHCGVSEQDKHNRETAALRAMVANIDPTDAEEIVALFDEYEAHESAESCFVHDLDKLDMILQADEYEAAQDIRLQEFFDSTRDVFRTDTGRALAQEVRVQRELRQAHNSGATTDPTAASGDSSQ